MSKAPVKTKDIAPPATEAEPVTVKAGKFAFTLVKDAGPPPPSATTRVNPLPFPDMFVTMGHNDTYFVPNSFWTAPKADGGRGLKADTSSTTMRTKIRESFNAWRKSASGKANATLTMMPRKKGDTIAGGGDAPEDGLQFWMQLS